MGKLKLVSGTVNVRKNLVFTQQRNLGNRTGAKEQKPSDLQIGI